MAEETTEPTTAAEGADAQPTDWEAKYRAAIEHSREWERKAKVGKYDELEEANMKGPAKARQASP